MLERVMPILLLTVACRSADESTTTDPIHGGRIDRIHEAVGEVGHLEGDEVGFHCSGTLIGPSTVLTAAHCLFLDGRRLYARSLFFAVGGVLHGVSRSSVDRDFDPSRESAWEDAALLRLDEPSEVGAIPVSIDPPLEGVEAQVIGFGVTRASAPGEGSGGGRRRRARITLDTVTEREIAYDASHAGACYGDSGGPIVQNDAVVGITSRGTADDCRGVDIAQRADVLAAWVGSTSHGDACIGWCE